MNIKENCSNLEIVLTDEQINDLARPLIRIVTEYYKDPKNEEKFQQWLKEREQPPESK